MKWTCLSMQAICVETVEWVQAIEAKLRKAIGNISQPPVRVVVMDIGGLNSRGINAWCKVYRWVLSVATQNQIFSALKASKDVVIIASSGNHGHTANDKQFPSFIAGVICVRVVDRFYKLTYFLNRKNKRWQHLVYTSNCIYFWV